MDEMIFAVTGLVLQVAGFLIDVQLSVIGAAVAVVLSLLKDLPRSSEDDPRQ